MSQTYYPPSTSVVTGPAALDAWSEAVVAEMRLGGGTRTAATACAATRFPELREQFVAAYNQASPDERRRFHSIMR